MGNSFALGRTIQEYWAIHRADIRSAANARDKTGNSDTFHISQCNKRWEMDVQMRALWLSIGPNSYTAQKFDFKNNTIYTHIYTYCPQWANSQVGEFIKFVRVYLDKYIHSNQIFIKVWRNKASDTMNFRWPLIVWTWLSYQTARNTHKRLWKASADKICLICLLEAG